MAPLALLAQHWLTTDCDTTETCCSRLLALGAPRGHLPVPPRLSQSNRHDNGEQRYRESPQHGLFLPLARREGSKMVAATRFSGCGVLKSLDKSGFAGLAQW